MNRIPQIRIRINIRWLRDGRTKICLTDGSWSLESIILIGRTSSIPDLNNANWGVEIDSSLALPVALYLFALF